MFDHVLKEAKAINVIPLDANPSDFRLYFDTYLANGVALQTYFPELKIFRSSWLKPKMSLKILGKSRLGSFDQRYAYTSGSTW